MSSLDELTNHFNRYFLIPVFVLGIGGNLLNLFVFSHRTLRSNPCACLFLFVSIGNIVCVTSGVVFRILSGWSADLTSSVDWLCKSRVFIVWSSRSFVMWTLAFASLDRWLVSCRSVRYRRMSNMKNTARGISLIFLFSLLISVDLFVCYEANLPNTPLKCYVRTELCRLLTDFVLAIIIYTIPLALMSLFGLLTVHNVRQLRTQRIRPSNISRVDQRLLRMLLIQILVLTTFTLPFAIQRLYSTLTINEDKSPVQQAIENFAFSLLFILSFAACDTPFFIFTLFGGQTFRTALFDTIRPCLGRPNHRR